MTNCLNYLDRGIIPGANGQFTDFVASSRELEGKGGASAAFGALQSAFIVGFSLTCVGVGHLIHSRSPFGMCGRGLVVWIFAAVVAGLARTTRSYLLLLLARMLSGVGEASFVTVGGPFIQDAGGAAMGLWLGVFYAAIPTGTALGYGYGAAIASQWNWSVAFYIEALAMLPLAMLFLLSEDDGRRVVTESGDRGDINYPGRTTLQTDVCERSITALSVSGVADETLTPEPSASSSPTPPTLIEEIRVCIAVPTFSWICLGYAGATRHLNCLKSKPKSHCA